VLTRSIVSGVGVTKEYPPSCNTRPSLQRAVNTCARLAPEADVTADPVIGREQRAGRRGSICREPDAIPEHLSPGQQSGEAALRFLGIGENNDLGNLYRRLLASGHEVRVFASEADATGVLAGIVPRADDWHRELPWVRAAGREGVILFEGVDQASFRTICAARAIR
jgi:hypothetical protein